MNMTHHGRFWLLLLGAFAAAMPTQALTDRANSYHQITGANVFRLKTRLARVEEPPIAGVPQIILQGVTSILGRGQVLFRTQPSLSGKIARYYVLSEGQSEDNIKVECIDVETGVIRFNNHGVLQILTMDKDSSKPERASWPALIRNKAVSTTPSAPQPGLRALTAEEQTIMIEVERERTRDRVEAGELPPLPPTELTPPGSRGAQLE